MSNISIVSTQSFLPSFKIRALANPKQCLLLGTVKCNQSSNKWERDKDQSRNCYRDLFFVWHFISVSVIECERLKWEHARNAPDIQQTHHVRPEVIFRLVVTSKLLWFFITHESHVDNDWFGGIRRKRAQARILKRRKRNRCWDRSGDENKERDKSWRLHVYEGMVRCNTRLNKAIAARPLTNNVTAICRRCHRDVIDGEKGAKCNVIKKTRQWRI